MHQHFSEHLMLLTGAAGALITLRAQEHQDARVLRHSPLLTGAEEELPTEGHVRHGHPTYRTRTPHDNSLSFLLPRNADLNFEKIKLNSLS